MKRLVSTLLVLAVAAGYVPAAGLHDHADAWLARGPAVAAVLGRPAGRWWAAAGQGRLFGLAELPQVALTVQHRAPRWRSRLAWESLGQGPFSERRAAADLFLGRDWRMGAAAEHCQLQCGRAYRSLQVWAAVSGPLGEAGRWWFHWPVVGPPAWAGPRDPGRWLRLQWQMATVVTAVVVDRRRDGTPVVASEVLLRLAGPLAWGVRHDGASGALGLVTAWRRGALLVRTSHLAHPYLGVTHRWSVGVLP